MLVADGCHLSRMADQYGQQIDQDGKFFRALCGF